jgi:biopolymer transport protein ExbD
MSHRSKPPVTEEKGPSLNLSSMLDVGFLMLIFFLLTAAQRPIEGI